MYERKQNSEKFFLLPGVTCSCFGSCLANGLVTERPQYSVVICIFITWQNTELSLILNDLRFIFTCPLFLAYPNTFHTARHTFATMMLTLGADLYTTSKLLGHADVKMTQVYAKIINQKKDDAVNLVNGLFD
nr:tyrosine-type recombinase/integrase [Odoribacter lunatus]